MGATLATKLFVPRPPAGLVRRPRLAAKLDDGLRCGLTLVIAPAGFGKTALLAHWATAADRPVAWLSLDSGDNDPVRFWRHVVHALGRKRSGLAELVGPALGTSAPSFDGVIAAIVNALASEPAALALVLDDYHLIENELVHDSVRRLLENAPPQLAVVLAGRADPPIPMARQRAGGRLAEIRVTDLRFTVEEATELLRGQAGSEAVVSSDAVSMLVARTEGWAAGLQLAALSLQGNRDVEAMVASFSGSHRFILDYLTEEVLAQQPEELQTFLHEASVLGVLSGPLCDAVTGRSGSQETLETIERANLFLVPLDDVRGWWRFHHLFGDLLYASMRRDRPTRVRELHRAAAAWHEGHGLVDEAIKHALAGDDGRTAARLVEHHADEYLMSSEDATLQRWLGILSPQDVATQPRLLLIQARLAVLAGRVAEGSDLLDAAERVYPAVADGAYEPSVGRPAGPLANVPAVIAVNRAFIANLRGDPDASATFATRALAEVDDDAWMLDSLARLHIGVAAWLRGHPTEGEPGVAAIIERLQRKGAADYAAVWSYVLGQIQSAQGRDAAAARTYRQALEVLADSSHRPAAGAVQVGLAELAYGRDDLDAARRHLEVALPLCRSLAYTQPLATGLAMHALVRHATGDRAGADDAMAEAAEVSPPGVVDLLNPVPTLQARLWLSRGDVDAAARWAIARGLSGDHTPEYPHEGPYLVLARVLLGQGRPAEALGLLDRLHTAAIRQGRHGSVVEIQVLRALALADRADDALAALTEALSLAPWRLRVFADEGEPIAALLRQFIAAPERGSPVPSRYLGRLLRAFGERATGGAAHRGGVDAVTRLSSRELEVLQLLAAGRANREIAGELFVSPHTVKRHVSHILDKLGAGNRTEAVARARDLGLLG